MSNLMENYKQDLLKAKESYTNNLATADQDVAIFQEKLDAKIQNRDSIKSRLDSIDAELAQIDSFEEWRQQSESKKNTRKKSEPEEVAE